MSSLIAGKRIAFTGAFYKMSRKEATAKATAVGAIVSPSFSASSCDFLVTGGAANEASAKCAKAKENGTEVIVEADFFKAIGVPVPQYDPSEFQNSARRGGGRAKKPLDYSSTSFGVKPAAKQQESSVSAPEAEASTPEANTVVQPDGTLNEQPVAVTAEVVKTAESEERESTSTSATATTPESSEDATAAATSEAKKPRGPRAERPASLADIETVPAKPVEMTNNGTIQLSGKTVVFTGRLANLNRLTAATLVHRMGGNVSASINSKTDLLVCGSGDGISLKREKAAGKGIATIAEDDFVAACAASNIAPPPPCAAAASPAAVPATNVSPKAE